MTAFSRMFTAHPQAVGESYFGHMIFAFGFSGRLIKAAFAALAHGVIPGVCETTASQAILDMTDEIRARRAAMSQPAAGPAQGKRALVSRA